MKISYLSDLHLEFGYGDLTLPGGDVLLLAGDIICAQALDKRTNKCDHNFRRFIEKETTKYPKVFMVMGNHEHYHGVVEQSRSILEKYIYIYDGKIQILENEIVELDSNLILFGATLWTDFANAHEKAMGTARLGMNDFHIISEIFADTLDGSKKPYRFEPESAFSKNKGSRAALRKTLFVNQDKKVIVMTHHTPSMQCGHPKWGGEQNWLNYAFHNTGLEDVVKDNQNLIHWICGHTHDSYEGYIHQCAVHINPRGYISRNGQVENSAFNPNLSFEVNL